MLDQLKFLLEHLKPNPKKFDEIYAELHQGYHPRKDPWGLNLKKHRTCFELIWPLYQYYFRVKFHHPEHIENKPYLIIANHSGQIAIDALLVMAAFLFEKHPPRVVRAMIDRFLPKLPFVGELVSEIGSVLGERQNCLHLLDHKETVLVFPEGVTGIAKPSNKFYTLQKFTTGFFRMAAQKEVEVLPLAIVGAEEFYPHVAHFPTIAKALGLPAFPVTPTFPWLGPLGILPLPSPVDIYVGKPYAFPKTLKSDAPDKDIQKHVTKLKKQIQKMIDEGLKQKRNYFGEVERVHRKRR